MESLNKQIKNLKLEVEKLKNKLDDLSGNTEQTSIRPYSKVGAGASIHIGSMDISSGQYHLDGDFNEETGMWYAYAIYHD